MRGGTRRGETCLALLLLPIAPAHCPVSGFPVLGVSLSPVGAFGNSLGRKPVGTGRAPPPCFSLSSFRGRGKGEGAAPSAPQTFGLCVSSFRFVPLVPMHRDCQCSSVIVLYVVRPPVGRSSLRPCFFCVVRAPVARRCFCLTSLLSRPPTRPSPNPGPEMPLTCRETCIKYRVGETITHWPREVPQWCSLPFPKNQKAKSTRQERCLLRTPHSSQILSRRETLPKDGAPVMRTPLIPSRPL